MGLYRYNLQNAYIDKSGYLICDVEFRDGIGPERVDGFYIEQYNNSTGEVYKFFYKDSRVNVYDAITTNVTFHKKFKINVYSDEYVQNNSDSVYSFGFGTVIDTTSSNVSFFIQDSYFYIKCSDIDSYIPNINPLTVRRLYNIRFDGKPELYKPYLDVIEVTLISGQLYYKFYIENINSYYINNGTYNDLNYFRAVYLLADPYGFTNVNYVYEQLDNKTLASISTADKIFNLIDNKNVGFLTNNKEKLIPYLDEKNLVEQLGCGVYKMAASVVSDFASQSNVTNLFNKNVGTVSYFTDNVKKYDLTLDVNQNGYIFGKKVDVNINKLEYKYILTGNGTDTIKGINILSPSYSLSCDKDWVNIKYINPYGIWDSLTLFGNITEQVNVNRTDAYRVAENIGLNRAKLNVGRQKFIGNNEINREYVFESDYVDYNTYRAFGEIIESKFTKIITNNTPISYTFSGTFSSVNIYEDIIINNTSFDYRNEREYKPLKLDFSYSSVKKSRN